MGHKFNRNSTDLNQAEIVKALRDKGVVVFITTAVKNFADLVTAYNGTWCVLEVKDGSQPPSKRRLTPGELKAVGLANSVGCQIYVVNSVDEAVNVVCG